jgi:hypothetical protein
VIDASRRAKAGRQEEVGLLPVYYPRGVVVHRSSQRYRIRIRVVVRIWYNNAW